MEIKQSLKLRFWLLFKRICNYLGNDKKFDVNWTFWQVISPLHTWHSYNILKGILRIKIDKIKIFRHFLVDYVWKKIFPKLLPCPKLTVYFLESTQRNNWMTHCNATLKPFWGKWSFFVLDLMLSLYSHPLFFYILTQYNASIKVKTARYVCKCSAACLLHLAAVELASKWIRMHILNGGH